MKKAVVLLSGGLDSSTCLAIANSKGYECYAISFNYGQRHSSELIAAQKIARDFKVKGHQIIELPIGQFGGSALTDQSLSVPKTKVADEIPVTYVPARNTIMLSFALGYAEVVEADAIYIGISSIDFSNYPDCRPDYLQAFTAMANLATKKGVAGKGIEIQAPLMYLSKAETILLGLSAGVDYAKTISCYQANTEGEACGKCHSCQLRKKGFEEAGVSDPTLYKIG